MKFKILKGHSTGALKELESIKKNIFNREDETNVFHFFEVLPNTFHVVFHLTDEYYMGSVKTGNKLNVPVSHYINCFFFEKNNFVFLEDISKNCTLEIIKFLNDKVSVSLENYPLNSNDLSILLNLFMDKGAMIKKLEYVNQEDDYYDQDYTSFEDALEINKNYMIEYASLNLKQNFISLYNSGNIAIDSNDEQMLIAYISEVANELENHSSSS